MLLIATRVIKQVRLLGKGLPSIGVGTMGAPGARAPPQIIRLDIRSLKFVSFQHFLFVPG